MEELQKTIQIKVSNETFIIKILTPAQVVEIESLKSQFTDGQYGRMSQTNTLLSNSALDYVDVVATFTVLIPELKTSLRVKSLFDLPIDSMGELVSEYKRFIKWWVSWINQMKSKETIA